MGTLYTEKQLIQAIEMARLGILDSEIIDYDSISGLTEICTYGLREAYTNEEIREKISAKEN